MNFRFRGAVQAVDEEKLLAMNKSLFHEAEAYMERHWYDKDFGDMRDSSSAIADYQRIQAKHSGSQLWQELLLVVNDNLEKKMKYEKRKENEA